MNERDVALTSFIVKIATSSSSCAKIFWTNTFRGAYEVGNDLLNISFG